MTLKNPPSDLYQSALPFRRADATPTHRRAPGFRVIGHKFQVGQSLLFSPDPMEDATQSGPFRVVCLLPAIGSENQYRLKSETDGHERVVRESQLASG